LVFNPNKASPCFDEALTITNLIVILKFQILTLNIMKPCKVPGLNIILDPWGHFSIKDYEKLFQQFGIEPIDKVIDLLPVKHHYFTRRIVFGHRDMNEWIKKYIDGRKTLVLTGFMPSGHVHLGHAMVFEELKYFQKLGVDVKIAIADAEAYAVRRLNRSDVINYGKEYIAHALAWGLEPDKTIFYFQTNYHTEYYRLIQMFSRKVTIAEMEAIYGDLSPAKIMASLTQVADILHSQMDVFGGFENIIVPVGADQDPHIRLARDIADRFSDELGFKRPASMYHKFAIGLDGNKMSSSHPEYAIFLNDDIDIIKKKITMALTGGRATAEEQRRLGGEPGKCSVYFLYMYHLIDENELKNVFDDCINGRVLCGECKRRLIEVITPFIMEHKKRYREIMDSGIVEKIVKLPSF